MPTPRKIENKETMGKNEYDEEEKKKRLQKKETIWEKKLQKK